MGDPEKSDDVDVPIIYNNVKDSWNSQLFEGLSQPGILPAEAKNILKASNNNGFIFMYMPITLSLCLFRHRLFLLIRYKMERNLLIITMTRYTTTDNVH